ncbi:alpha/beta fold hydrolase [Hydrogenophaga sp. UC242_50]|uniref:alpha/beta fold hydrolase n=1 Tax=Hydrogenophaga sp. UC242_50 TaxID=3350169 RepID=UPI0036D380E5
MRTYELPDYLVSGEGPTTVYLLHGAYGAKEYWRCTTQALNQAGYRVVAWDAPGYGTSPVPDTLSMTDMARVAGRLIGATSTGRNVVLGHSMGGMVAQKTADLFPDRVQALVLSATAHTFNHSGPEWQANFLATRRGAPDTGPRHRGLRARNAALDDGTGRAGPRHRPRAAQRPPHERCRFPESHPGHGRLPRRRRVVAHRRAHAVHRR